MNQDDCAGKHEQLNESEVGFKSIFEHAPSGIYLADSKSRIVQVNHEFCEMIGYSAQEILNRTFRDFIHHADIKVSDEFIRRLVSGEIDFCTQEKRYIHKDGHVVWVSKRVSLLRGTGGEIQYFITHVRDISERITNENKLRETGEYLENLLNYANAPIIVWDPDFKITRFNHAFERLTGRGLSEVVGRKLDILFPEDRKEESLAHIRRTFTGERWETVEIPILRVDGTVRTVLWNSATLYASDGKTVVATIAQGQDITERKQAEIKLRETGEYLENLLNYANAPVIVWDPDFRITRFNHAFERLTGRGLSEVVGRKLDILFPEDRKEESLAHIRRTFTGERWETVEIPILRVDGTVRTV
ncbi:MAG: PAS domain S-box protein, partial [Planctomycetes bacterium]|nr:PAS domain S-box protein [Planctomycetota bacterium]